MTYIDRWILNKLNRTIKSFDESFEAYNFAEATSGIYSFWQDILCDVYVEAVKPIFTAGNAPNASEEAKTTANISKNVLRQDLVDQFEKFGKCDINIKVRPTPQYSSITSL